MPEHRDSVTVDGLPARRPPTDGGRFGRVTRRLLDTVGGRLWGLHVEGGDGLPMRGPAIIAANHLSFFDSVALMMAVPRPLSFVGKAEYMGHWKTRHLLPALGMIPISRSSAFQAWDALEAAAGVLRADGVFAIYPEGSRSRDGKLHAGHTGVGHLGVATGAPIIPTGIMGTDRVQPPGARIPRPFRPVVVRFGRPIDAGAYRGSRRERRRRITHDVMTAIGDLTGQTYGRDGREPMEQPAGSALDVPPTGETLEMAERMIVSPATGTFTPLLTAGAGVTAGQVIGHVRAGINEVPVCTPFTGTLVDVVAWEGERLQPCQLVARLLAA
jgi:1-acyl-sn-glycerol-3-phosphate acyltransferase